jgi:molybdopterin-guanine dinucleotide biosynthesis protein B
MRRYAVAFTGVSNSGKTTLIEKIAKKLIKTKKIAIIKHDPKDKAIFDIEGKDSFKFFQTGAEVIVTSPKRTTYFSHRQRELDKLIELFGEFDLLMVEGLKTTPLPRIAIFRDSIDSSYFKYCNAIAVDSSIDKNQLPKDIDILDLNNIDMIIEWIEKNAKEV